MPATITTPQEGVQKRVTSLNTLCHDMGAELEAIETELMGFQEKLEAVFETPYKYVHFYDCGRECRGCPHPSLARLPQKAPWLARMATPEHHALRKRFRYLVRRRGRLLQLMQTMHMSIYRLGGASHRAAHHDDDD